jgi:hypothetical protein
MNTYADENQQNKTHAIANIAAGKQSDDAPASRFIDNRQEAIAQRKLGEAINNSPQVKQLRGYQEMADNHVSKIAQRKESSEEENLLQGRFAVQRQSGIEGISGLSQRSVIQRYYVKNPETDAIRWENTIPIPAEYNFLGMYNSKQRGLDSLYMDSSSVPDREDLPDDSEEDIEEEEEEMSAESAGSSSVHDREDLPDESEDDEEEEEKEEEQMSVAPAVGGGGGAGMGLPLHKISTSSAHHSLGKLKKMAPSAAKKSYGFSFVDKTQEEADIRLINSYISTQKSPKDIVITHAPATHAGAKEGMMAYTINGRVYSTHQKTQQVFPVSGPGISSGKGPDQMMALLKSKGTLTLQLYFKLTGGNKWAQTAKPQQQITKAAYNAYMKK